MSRHRQNEGAIDRARGGLSLEEIAKIEGLTRERIRQIEHQALRKMRQALIAKGYTVEQARILLTRGQS